jgi:hypothetical protein
MMKARRRPVALLGSALVLTVGLVIAFAGGGSAAGVHICPSTDCIKASLFPRYVAVGSNGLAIAKFTNEANATATHTVVSVQLPPGTTAAAITSAPPATCGTDTVSCSLGSVTGGSTVKVYVQFTAVSASSDPVSATATVSFAESNGTSPTNDVVVSEPSNGVSIVDTTLDTAVDGRCANAGTVTGSTTAQAIKSSISSAAGLPCAPVDVGVDLGPTGVVTGNNRIVFVDLPVFADGTLADVTYDLVTLPTGTNVNHFVLYEVLGYPTIVGTPATNPSNFLVVPPCVDHALPPAQAGNTYDSCIDSRAKFGSKGIELKLKVLGQGVDPSYWG